MSSPTICSLEHNPSFNLTHLNPRNWDESISSITLVCFAGGKTRSPLDNEDPTNPWCLYLTMPSLSVQRPPQKGKGKSRKSLDHYTVRVVPIPYDRPKGKLTEPPVPLPADLNSYTVIELKTCKFAMTRAAVACQQFNVVGKLLLRDFVDVILKRSRHLYSFVDGRVGCRAWCLQILKDLEVEGFVPHGTGKAAEVVVGQFYPTKEQREYGEKALQNRRTEIQVGTFYGPLGEGCFVN